VQGVRIIYRAPPFITSRGGVILIGRVLIIALFVRILLWLSDILAAISHSHYPLVVGSTMPLQTLVGQCIAARSVTNEPLFFMLS